MSPSRRPTLRDVAAEAGVSFKTVSRVVNGEPGVSPQLTDRVERAIDALRYRPDDRARLLRRQASPATAIGFVLVDVANPFFGSLLRGIEEVAVEHKSLVLAGSTDGSSQREQDLVQAFVGRRVDGLIVVSSTAHNPPLLSEIERGTPVVFLDLEPGLANIDLVRTDHRAGATLATRHLIEHGHRNIAYFGDDDSAITSASERLEGYRTAMTAAGLPVPTGRVTTGSHDDRTWQQLVIDHLASRHRATALVTAQNLVTLGAVRALHQLGLQHEIALVGFDDVDLADVVEPALTVVPQHPRQLGRRAAELLFARLDGDDRDPVQIIVEPELLQRGSGELPGPDRAP